MDRHAATAPGTAWSDTPDAPQPASIAIAIKLTDGGPIFYTQIRVGRRDKPFKMIKFRSMVVNADKMKAELAKETGQDGRFIIQNEGRSASHQGRQVYP